MFLPETPFCITVSFRITRTLTFLLLFHAFEVIALFQPNWKRELVTNFFAPLLFPSFFNLHTAHFLISMDIDFPDPPHRSKYLAGAPPTDPPPKMLQSLWELSNLNGYHNIR